MCSALTGQIGLKKQTPVHILGGKVFNFVYVPGLNHRSFDYDGELIKNYVILSSSSINISRRFIFMFQLGLGLLSVKII